MNLKKLIEKNNMSLYDLAKKSGVSVNQLYHISKYPTVNVSINTVGKIYKTTGLLPQDYLEGDFSWLKK